jgi:hypothetical protein
MTGFVHGTSEILTEQIQGSVEAHHDYPETTDAKEAANYTQLVLKHQLQLPVSIQAQINAIEQLSLKILDQ